MSLGSSYQFEEVVDLDWRDCPQCYQRMATEELFTSDGELYQYRHCLNCDYEEDVDEWLLVYAASGVDWGDTASTERLFGMVL